MRVSSVGLLVFWLPTLSCRPQEAHIHEAYESLSFGGQFPCKLDGVFSGALRTRPNTPQRVDEGRHEVAAFCAHARCAGERCRNDLTTSRRIFRSTALPRSLQQNGGGNFRTRSLRKFESLPSETFAFEPTNGIRLPLLDLTSSFVLEERDGGSQDKSGRSDHERTLIQLPSSHLPEVLRSLSLYQMHLTSPVHKMVVKDAIGAQSPSDFSEDSFSDTSEAAWMSVAGSQEHLFGRLLARPTAGGDLVGAVGCAAEIVICAPTKISEDSQALTSNKSQGDSAQISVLSRGAFRFVVREVLQTFPYPVAMVEELHDDDIIDQDLKSSQSHRPFGEAGDEVYMELNPNQLLQRTMSAVDTLVETQRNANFTDLSPLEQAILEQHLQSQSSDGPVRLPSAEDARAAADEVAAVWQAFASTLDDLARLPVQRNYAVAMLAAELAEVSNEVRQAILQTTNGVQRLRVVLREAERRIEFLQAQERTNDIVESSDQSSKDLQVGEPSMPPWASSIRQGTKVEYYWNEEFGWCSGIVIDDPLLVVNEYVLTIRFDDGYTYRLPLNPDEKVRWRPA